MNTSTPENTGEFAGWVVWVVMGVGFMIAPITIWIAMRQGLPAQTIAQIEYTLFTVGMLGNALCHMGCKKYAKKLEKYRLIYEFFVPGAYGSTKIQQTYRYLTEKFSENDKNDYKIMQVLAHSSIFFMCIAFGYGAYLLFINIGK